MTDTDKPTPPATLADLEPARIEAQQLVQDMTRAEKRAAHRSMRRRGKGWTR